MEPIETEYQRYRFRSRLEARWAVFLNHIGVEWDYEPQGFEFDGGERYLPDFWVETWDCWIEVKGPEPTDQDKRLAYLLAEGSGKPVVLGYGQFKLQQDQISGTDTVSPVCHVFYGDSEQAFDYLFGYHENYQSHPVSPKSMRSPLIHAIDLCKHLRGEGYEIKYTHDAQTLETIVRLDEEYWANEYGGQHPKWKYGWVLPLHSQAGGPIVETSVSDDWPLLKIDKEIGYSTVKGDELRAAYHAAQSARFEHGENGAV
jgi:hypothetical protein